MRFILFLLLAGITPIAHAERDKDPVYAVAENGSILFTVRGQIAKDIFDNMPKGSKLTPKNGCYVPPESDQVTKVQGGFICVFYPKLLDDLYFAYVCNIATSIKTGKALLRNPKDYCEEDE